MHEHFSQVCAAIRHRTEGGLAYEDDAGDIAFGPYQATTLVFDPGSEKLYATMSACPGGHESVEEFLVQVDVAPLAPPAPDPE